jgi:hypothetical protein
MFLLVADDNPRADYVNFIIAQELRELRGEAVDAAPTASWSG